MDASKRRLFYFNFEFVRLLKIKLLKQFVNQESFTTIGYACLILQDSIRLLKERLYRLFEQSIEQSQVPKMHSVNHIKLNSEIDFFKINIEFFQIKIEFVNCVSKKMCKNQKSRKFQITFMVGYVCIVGNYRLNYIFLYIFFLKGSSCTGF